MCAQFTSIGGGFDSVGFALPAISGNSSFARLSGPTTSTGPSQEAQTGIGDIGFGLDLYDRKIYVALNNTDQVRVYDADTLDEVWRHNHHTSYVRGISVSDGVVYSGDGDGNVVAADAQTGNQNWSVNLYSFANHIKDYGDYVYVGSSTFDSNSSVFSLNKSDGSTNWEHTHHGTSGLFLGDLAVNENYVASGDETGKVVLANRNDGSLVNQSSYHSDTPLGMSIGEGSTDSVVYTASNDGTAKAYDMGPQTQLWSKTYNSTPSDIHRDNDAVFVINKSGKIEAIDRSNGSVYWTYTSGPSDGGQIISSGDELFAISDPGFNTDYLTRYSYSRNPQSYNVYVSDDTSWYKM